MASLIEIDNLSFTYPQAGDTAGPALRGISLKIEDGEYVAIVGRNGSGKTTLAHHLNALLLPTGGSVRIAGLDTREPAHHSRVRALVGMVFQSPEDQIIATTVEEDVAFGPENLGLPSAEIRARVEDALQQVELDAERERPPHALSAGQMQRLALAGVLAVRPRSIIFDEVTAMLDPAGRQAVLAILQRLNAEGLTILTITHSMEEAALAKRVIILHQGQVALDGSPAQVFSDEQRLVELGLELPAPAALARDLLGRLPALPAGILTTQALLQALESTPQLGPVAETSAAPAGQAAFPDPLLEVDGLGHVYRLGTPLAHRALIGVDLRVAENHSHGLIGATGSGKSTLLQHLNGLLIPQEGRVRLGEFLLNDPKVDLLAVRRMAGLVMQIPETQFFEQFLIDEIAYGPRMLGRTGTLREDILSAMQMVGLDYERYKDRLTFDLSGGERRKVALASILAIHPRVLLLDEPFLGLDPASHHEILGRFKAMQTGGRTLVLSSHHMEDLVELTENLTVMQAGRSVLSGSLGEVFGLPDGLHQYGLEVPLAARAAGLLRARGWPLPAGILTRPALIEALNGSAVHE